MQAAAAIRSRQAKEKPPSAGLLPRGHGDHTIVVLDACDNSIGQTGRRHNLVGVEQVKQLAKSAAPGRQLRRYRHLMLDLGGLLGIEPAQVEIQQQVIP